MLANSKNNSTYINAVHRPNIYFKWTLLLDGIFKLGHAVERLEAQINVVI